MKIKTNELTGPALDWAVAKALGIRTYIGRYQHTMTGPCILDADLVDMQTDDGQELKFSTDWAQGGPIIERDGMHVDCLRQGKAPVWEAWPYASGTKHIQQGPTPLIAAMRGYVASRLGDEVDIPEELCTS